MVNQIIIIGGGRSVQELINLHLWGRIRCTFTIGTNFSYKDYIPTILCALDNRFFTGEYIPISGVIRGVYRKDEEHLSKLPTIPLIYTSDAHKTVINAPKNVHFLKTTTAYAYMKKSISEGFYTHSLTGHWALSIAANILDYSGEIYLLGFDANKSGNTHYYSHTQHAGINYTNYYANKANDLNTLLLPYSQEPNLKVYNVSSISEIKIFPKLTPQEFFDKVVTLDYSQEELREYCISKLELPS